MNKIFYKLIFLLFFVTGLYSATCTVDTTIDNIATDGSLRKCLDNVYNGDTINITTTGTIKIATSNSPFSIQKNITIIGNKNLQVSGDEKSLVFMIEDGTKATLKNLNIVDGKNTSSNGGGIYLKNAELTLIDTSLYSNTAKNGGAIAIEGNNNKLFMVNSIIHYY